MNFLIWSNQHQQWWRPRQSGYTPIIEEAGRYSFTTADGIVRSATIDGALTYARINPVTGERYLYVDEVMVLAPEDVAELVKRAERLQTLLDLPETS